MSDVSERRLAQVLSGLGRVLEELGKEMVAAAEPDFDFLENNARAEEREAVVRYLNRLDRDEDSGWGSMLKPGWRINDLADAIKAGKHRETNEADEAWARQGSEQGAMGPVAVPTGTVPPSDTLVGPPPMPQDASEELARSSIIMSRLGYVAPELWSAKERAAVRRHAALAGEPLRPELAQVLDLLDSRDSLDEVGEKFSG